MATNGNNILIYVGGSLVAGTRSDEIQTDAGLIEISSPDTGDWAAFIAGRKTWAFSQSWLLPAAADLSRLLQVGTTVTIRIVGRGESLGLTGSAIVRTCKITNTRGNLANGSFAFQGTGPLTQETPPETTT